MTGEKKAKITATYTKAVRQVLDGKLTKKDLVDLFVEHLAMKDDCIATERIRVQSELNKVKEFKTAIETLHISAVELGVIKKRH